MFSIQNVAAGTCTTRITGAALQKTNPMILHARLCRVGSSHSTHLVLERLAHGRPYRRPPRPSSCTVPVTGLYPNYILLLNNDFTTALRELITATTHSRFFEDCRRPNIEHTISEPK